MSSLAFDDTIARLDQLTDVSITPSTDGTLLGYVASGGIWQAVSHITVPSGVLTTDNAAHIGGIVFHSGGIISEGTATPGNARGANAVDLQSTRTSATQVASGTSSVILGGQNNTASGNQSVAGGNGNQATGTNSAAPFGANAIASLFGQFSQSSGFFSTGGDAQTSVLTARNTTTDATPTEIFLNGSSSRLTLATGRAFAYHIIVLARYTASGVTTVGAFESRGVLSRGTGNVVLMTGNTDLPLAGANPATLAFACTADTTNQSLKMTATGIAATTIHWIARITIVETA